MTAQAQQCIKEQARQLVFATERTVGASQVA